MSTVYYSIIYLFDCHTLVSSVICSSLIVPLAFRISTVFQPLSSRILSVLIILVYCRFNKPVLMNSRWFFVLFVPTIRVYLQRIFLAWCQNNHTLRINHMIKEHDRFHQFRIPLSSVKLRNMKYDKPNILPSNLCRSVWNNGCCLHER